MDQPQPFAAPAIPFHRAFAALLGFGRDLLGRVQAAITHRTTTYVPRRFARNPIAAEQRIARTLDWIVALARTLAGDRTWLITPTHRFPRWPTRFPSLTAKLRAECGLPPVPPRTEAQKAAAHRRYVRKVFATLPVAKIAARLARRLGIANSSDAWPRELLSITQTPAAYAHAAQPPKAYTPTATHPPPKPPSPPPTATGPP